jgi:hypothetical protein
MQSLYFSISGYCFGPKQAFGGSEFDSLRNLKNLTAKNAEESRSSQRPS